VQQKLLKRRNVANERWRGVLTKKKSGPRRNAVQLTATGITHELGLGLLLLGGGWNDH
jgi:hypothetical protein